MYQLNETETWREHRRDLLREAENARLVRRPKAGHRALASVVRRRAALLLSTMGLAVLLAAGAAYALDIQCQPGSNDAGNECLGTDARDIMDGTGGNDDIRGLGDNDVIRGLGGIDALEGDDQELVSLSRQGDDEVFGGAGGDDLIGSNGSDLLSGGRGDDFIEALEASSNGGVDTVKGGRGNDRVSANDGQRDVIDCGDGRDSVEFDAGLDTLKNCEIKEAL